MSLNQQLTGQRFGPEQVSWDSTDAICYALGIGAGCEDALSDLALTTENSLGVQQVVFPTFPLVLEPDFDVPYGDFDPAMLVHAEQGLTAVRPLPASGSARVETVITGTYDKGSGALIRSETTATEDGTSATLWQSWSTIFIRGEGGFGGDRDAPGSSWRQPEREPDQVASYRTHAEQALLYRLSGDRNPLHSDPAFAARAGFDRPILHGLCTYGISARLALRLLGAPPGALQATEGRFTSPVTPGEELQIRLWRLTDEEAVFQTCREDGTVVLDRGRIQRAGRERAASSRPSGSEAGPIAG